MEFHRISTAFSSALFSLYDPSESVVVVVDVLRATTSICTAFANGASAIIPLATPEEAEELAKRGFLTASEKDGRKRDFATFGNSPSEFCPERVWGQEIGYCTTNGTRAIKLATEQKARALLIGAFVNLTLLSEFLIKEHPSSVFIFCSGWKGRFNLEDTLFAGALASRLMESGKFGTVCDSTKAALALWEQAEEDWPDYAYQAAHIERLRRIGQGDSVAPCFELDTCPVVPQYAAGRILRSPLGRG